MSDAAAFAAHEAIRAGNWDRHLTALMLAVRDRQEVLNPYRPPSLPLPSGQVWAWMGGATPPHWEACGTGALLDPSERQRGTDGIN